MPKFSSQLKDDDITTLLAQSRAGSEDATERLLQLVYPELKAIAARLMSGESAGDLQTTDLVHETYLRLFHREPLTADNRVYFFFVASRAMRQTLVECARARLATKRGGGAACVPISEVDGQTPDGQFLIKPLAIDAALDRLAAHDERAAKVVELHFFCDLNLSEIAQVLELGERTIRDDWKFAKAWLKNQLGDMV